MRRARLTGHDADACQQLTRATGARRHAPRGAEASFAVWAERAWQRIIPVPFCFMGMGIFRVWTETLYANSQVNFPALVLPFSVPIAGADAYSLFDLVAALALTLLALGARRVAPLYRHPVAIVATVVCMVGAAMANFGSILAPAAAEVLFWPSVFGGGVGVALILMLWSEFFGCLSPLRIAVYYSASVVVGCLVLWIFKGLSFWWLWAGTCAVPIVSLMCLWRAYATLSPDAYPPAYQGEFSFPWKPVAVVGAYSFVYGLRGGVFSGYLGMNSGIGAFLGALLVYALICASVQRGSPEAAGDDAAITTTPFDFSLLWKIAMPLMLASLVPLEHVVPGWSFVADTCALASYTVLLVLIMSILGNLSYRYGVCALWIFAIERAVRLLTSQAGRVIGNSFGDVVGIGWHALLVLVMAAMLVVVALLFFSEKNVSSSDWGVVLKRPADGSRNDAAARALERNRLGVKCEELGRQRGLTPREEEVMLLLAQRRTLGEISRELYVAPNTVKTHSKHVYQKLGIHSRAELLDMLGVRSEPRQ